MQALTYQLTVIVPIYARSTGVLDGLLHCYEALLEELKLEPNMELDLIFIDSSPLEATCAIESALSGRPQVRWRRTLTSGDPGVNGKLVNVNFAMGLAKFDNIALLDDDARPSLGCLVRAAKELHVADAVRLAPWYPSPRLVDAIDMAGVLVVNAASPDRQFWGNLCFRRSSLPGHTVPRVDVVFDELLLFRAIRGQRRDRKSTFDRYVYDTPLEMRASRSLMDFARQRTRYAYENLAYPIRFSASLMVLPTLLTLLFRGLVSEALALTALLVVVLTVLAFVDRRRWPANHLPIRVPLLAPIWFLPYPICSWIALYLFVRGGVRFGDSIIRRPA